MFDVGVDGVQTIHQLIARADKASGLKQLYSNHRLTLSVDALVLKKEYRSLFSDEESRTLSSAKAYEPN